tara:strand:- start:44 stop:994 length:951 start_codon:yes stop_codon:yes gene_type:complete
MTWSSFEKDKLLTESWRKFLHEEGQVVFGLNSDDNPDSLKMILADVVDKITRDKIIALIAAAAENESVVLEAVSLQGSKSEQDRVFSSETTREILQGIVGLGLNPQKQKAVVKALNYWGRVNTVKFEKPAAPPSPAATPEPDEPSITDASTARAASASAAAAIRATPPRTTSGSDDGWTPWGTPSSSSAPPTPAAADIDVEKINDEIKKRYNTISLGNRLPVNFDIWKTSILDIEGVKTIEKKIVKTGDSRQPLFVIELSNGKKFGLPPQMDFDNIKNLFKAKDTVHTGSRLKKVIKLAVIQGDKITTKGLVGITR